MWSQSPKTRETGVLTSTDRMRERESLNKSSSFLYFFIPSGLMANWMVLIYTDGFSSTFSTISSRNTLTDTAGIVQSF
jgi:hypothetical protein